MKIELLFFLSLSTLLLRTTVATNMVAPVSEFCWREARGRGVGTIPPNCPGMEKIGLLCYKACPEGTKRVGVDCHSKCPEGWRDDGLGCRLAEYARLGVFNMAAGTAQLEQCEQKAGKGNCEKDVGLYYPKCKPGFVTAGVAICRPEKAPVCEQFGLLKGLDLTCTKKVTLGDVFGPSCDSGKEKNAGLCYQPCPNGFLGVGPVCWQKPPTGWVECGMGAATTNAVCSKTIIDQIMSVGKLLLNIVTLGTLRAATQKEREDRLDKILQKWKALNETFQAQDKSKANTQTDAKLKEIKSIADGIGEISKTANSNDVTAEDIARVAAQAASVIDPLGVTDVVAAYTYPKCTKLFPIPTRRNKRFTRRNHRKSKFQLKQKKASFVNI